MAFTHLHLHTEYSLLESSLRIKELFVAVKAGGMSAVAITDKNVLFGAVEFYQEAIKAGVKPIIGAEIHFQSSDAYGKRVSYPLVLLVEDNSGYQNLIQLLSKSQIEKNDLKKHSQGLIALAGGLQSEISIALLKAEEARAIRLAIEYQEIYGVDNFFLELQDHNLNTEKSLNLALAKLSEQTGIALVASNDVRYLQPEDYQVQAVLLAIKNSTKLKQVKIKREYYLKSDREMRELFASFPSAISNTEKIAERCHFEFDFNSRHLPRFPLPSGQTATTYLQSLCQQNLLTIYGQDDKAAQARLEKELKTINDMGFADYFLLVADFVKFAKDNNILVGPARGSVGGSIVAYLLNITEVDPLRYGLIFERFLNPERITMPDIDIDFQDDRRQEVIDYVSEKYGQDHVAQIITFGTLAARAAIRDVGRVLELPYAIVDQTARSIRQQPKMTISKALAENQDLARSYQNNREVKRLIDIAKSIEGLPRHCSTHAAGIVISARPLAELVPLYHQGDGFLTQYDMEKIEQLGLLKFDFLGLRTLTIIQQSLQSIKTATGQELDFKNHTYDDRAVYDLIASGRTLGIFQLESKGMIRFLQAYKPQNLEDIIAAISLYRPGPMESIPLYLKNKKNPDKITYLDPKLKDILESSYGCLVYQEQVMQIVRHLAGYSYGRADLVRRAMSKKKMAIMAKEREIFLNGLVDEADNVVIEGCKRRGISAETANAIFDQMKDFAKYAFSKLHAAGYAMIAYQTAYLKAHYPEHFLAITMSNHLHSQHKIKVFIRESKQLNITILAPDVQHSFAYFKAEEGSIRYALTAIKNIGKKIAESIVIEREKKAFKDFEDFIRRMLAHDISRNAVEALIKAGALDSLNPDRGMLLVNYERMIDCLQEQRRQNADGQISLLDDNVDVSSSYKYFKSKPLAKSTILNFELEFLGIYLSGHPLEQYETELKQSSSLQIIDLLEAKDEQEVELNNSLQVLAGMVKNIRIKATRKGEDMAFVSLQDLSGEIEIIFFPKQYALLKTKLANNAILKIKGRVKLAEDEPMKFIAQDLKLLDVESANAKKIIPQRKPQNLYLRLQQFNDEEKAFIKSWADKYGGDDKLIIYEESSKSSSIYAKGIDSTVHEIEFLVQRYGAKNIVLKEQK